METSYDTVHSRNLSSTQVINSNIYNKLERYATSFVKKE